MALALVLAVVVGTAMLGFLGAAVSDTQGQLLTPTPASALGRFLAPVLMVVLLGALAGALGWLGLFLSGRDGFHRMEWVALLPFNYGGRSPFDTSDWHVSK